MMVLLTGKNLGERHKELNLKVIEAVDKNLDLNDIKIQLNDAKSDVDQLFQIDLASRYKNIEFILEILKSGDSLYVTRAIKCGWIYDDKYSNLMCPSYLHQNIFPQMSIRMKYKMLATTALHVRNEERVICFYSYCISYKLNLLALKFLVHTTETFKMDLIQYDDDFWSFDDPKNLKYFIGSSFAIATAYVDMYSSEDQTEVIHDMRFLYTVSQESYLDMLQKYVKVDAHHPNSIRRLGIRISRDILKTYKTRFWKDVVLFTNLLNKSMLVKYLTSEEVKKIVPLLLPSSAASFWSADFYHSYKFILDLIPSTEIFAYLRDIFCLKYKNELYEMNINFYELEYYKMLTVEEQEAWALHHIERELNLFGSGNDYIWYKFVGFDKAIEGIKQYVYRTPDNDKRTEIVKILVHSAKNNEDLQKLLNYYYDRHVNESNEHKMSFINLIISTHDVYGFNIECWGLFYKLLYSLENFDSYYYNMDFKNYYVISMIYHIVNKIEFSEEDSWTFQEFFKCEKEFGMYYEIIKGLSIERINLVVKYWLNYHAEIFKVLLEKTIDDEVKKDIKKQIGLIWSLIKKFHRDKKECPEIVLTYMKSNLDIYENHPALKKEFVPMEEKDFVRLLKSDIQKVIDSTSKVECNSYRWLFRLNRFFKKIKVYFLHDVSEVYLKYFLDLLQSLKDTPKEGRIFRNIKVAVAGVLQLGSEEQINTLLKNYAPLSRKIYRPKINPYQFQVQKAICRLAYQSRPPVQLSIIQKYITGDYVRFCLPIFDNYLMNLPIHRAMEFIKGLIDSPVSIQKHGLRLAFQCFEAQDLVKIILKSWNKTKNVSLRMILYKTLFAKMVNEDGDYQQSLYEVLKMYTSELNHQDHEELFNLLISDDMPDEYKGDYIETAWQTISEFSNKNANIIRKTNVINHIKKYINLVNRDFIGKNIIDAHVRRFFENRLKVMCNNKQLQDLTKAKWELTAIYIASGNTTKDILNNNIKLTNDILNKIMNMWDHTYKGIYTYRQFCNSFLNTLHKESCRDSERYTNVTAIYRCIFLILQESLSKEELYLPQWKHKLYIESQELLYEHYLSHAKSKKCEYSCVAQMAEKYANKVGKLVKSLVGNNRFYHCFYEEMAYILRTICEIMDQMLNSKEGGFQTLFSSYLTQIRINESQVLAVMIMPKSPPKGWVSMHESALKKMKLYGSEEILCKLYKKTAFRH